MEPNSNQRIPPPSANQAKQVQSGSFFKRNWWIFLVIGVVALFGLIGWYVVSRVRHAVKQYEALAKQVDTTTSAGTELDTVYKAPYIPSIKTAKLKLTGGAASYRLSDTTGQLFSADAKLFHGKYLVYSSTAGSDYFVHLSMKNKGRSQFFGEHSDSVNFKLNPRPIWAFDINTGAADLDFDLSKYKVLDLKLYGGAGQFTLKMGEPLASSDIDIETGASDVTINIPKDAACSIEALTSLSSNEFEGFMKKDKGNYETPNFNAAKNKYRIHISGGISDFKIHLY